MVPLPLGFLVRPVAPGGRENRSLGSARTLSTLRPSRALGALRTVVPSPKDLGCRVNLAVPVVPVCPSRGCLGSRWLLVVPGNLETLDSPVPPGHLVNLNLESRACPVGLGLRVDLEPRLRSFRPLLENPGSPGTPASLVVHPGLGSLGNHGNPDSPDSLDTLGIPADLGDRRSPDSLAKLDIPDSPGSPDIPVGLVSLRSSH